MKTALFILYILFSTATLSKEETIILNCEFEKTFDPAKATTTLTSGSFSYKATITDDEYIFAEVSGEAPCTPQIGIATKLEFNTSCSWEYDKNQIEEPLKISRINGEFSQQFRYNKKIGLIHYGKCKKASQLF